MGSSSEELCKMKDFDGQKDSGTERKKNQEEGVVLERWEEGQSF